MSTGLQFSLFSSENSELAVTVFQGQRRNLKTGCVIRQQFKIRGHYIVAGSDKPVAIISVFVPGLSRKLDSVWRHPVWHRNRSRGLCRSRGGSVRHGRWWTARGRGRLCGRRPEDDGSVRVPGQWDLLQPGVSARPDQPQRVSPSSGGRQRRRQ